MPPPRMKARSTASTTHHEGHPPPETPQNPSTHVIIQIDDDKHHDTTARRSIIRSSPSLGFRPPSSKRSTTPLVLPDKLLMKITSQAKWLDNQYTKTLRLSPSLPEKDVRNTQVAIELYKGHLSDTILGVDLTRHLRRI